VFSLFLSDANAETPLNIEALELLTRLRKVEWGSLLTEYLSFEETCSKAVAAMGRNEIGEADRLFQMAILKGVILEKSTHESGYDESDDTADASRLVGNEFMYRVSKRDTVRLIAAKFGISSRNILRLNRLKKGEPLKEGQRLKIITRRILPKGIEDGILINIPDRTMYLFRDGKLATMYPVALGKPSIGENRGWHTPTGAFSIVGKARDPVWKVPPSIRKEMKSLGKEVLEEVPPGDANPLGRYVLRTSIPGILIHGTNLPSSIYGFNSHGCIRVYPENMEQLFRTVSVRTQGEIVYKPVKVAESDTGRIFLEVHPDVYDKVNNLEVEAWKIISNRNMNDRVDWEKVMNAVDSRSGIPEDVTRELPEAHSAKRDGASHDDG
jgi:L,D-transpeptidase ErfK/SrfK